MPTVRETRYEQQPNGDYWEVQVDVTTTIRKGKLGIGTQIAVDERERGRFYRAARCVRIGMDGPEVIDHRKQVVADFVGTLDGIEFEAGRAKDYRPPTALDDAEQLLSRLSPVERAALAEKLRRLG